MTPRLQEIAAAVSYGFEVDVADLRGPSKRKPFTRARFAFCAMAKAKTPRSLNEIGAWLGGRDHTTIMNAENRGLDLLARDAEFAAMFKASSEALTGAQAKVSGKRMHKAVHELEAALSELRIAEAKVAQHMAKAKALGWEIEA